MFKTFIPFAKAKSVYEIDLNFFTKLGIKNVLVDLDNTLDSYKLFVPTERAFKLKESFDTLGIRMIIVSNNKGKRVSSYANKLGVEYLPNTGKPFPFKLNKLIKEKGLNLSETIFIGDQMMTDMVASKKAGLRNILTDKIVKEDQWTTRINRLLGNRIRNYHKRHGNFVDWREIYGKD